MSLPRELYSWARAESGMYAQTMNEILHVCDNFPIAFERDTGLNIDYCSNIIEDPDSMFCGFSYIVKFILTLLDSSNCEILLIRTPDRIIRKNIYITLSKFSIPFIKNVSNSGTDILIDNLFYIPDFRTGYHSRYNTHLYQDNFNSFTDLYSLIDNNGGISITNTDYNIIIVSLEHFIKFKRIQFSHRPRDEEHVQVQSVSPNYKIKHQLADLIFDVKENLTDSTFKEIMEKISLIST